MNRNDIIGSISLWLILIVVAFLVALSLASCEDSSTEVQVNVPDTVFVAGAGACPDTAFITLPPDTVHVSVPGDTVWVPCPPGLFRNGKCEKGG